MFNIIFVIFAAIKAVKDLCGLRVEFIVSFGKLDLSGTPFGLSHTKLDLAFNNYPIFSWTIVTKTLYSKQDRWWDDAVEDCCDDIERVKLSIFVNA